MFYKMLTKAYIYCAYILIMAGISVTCQTGKDDGYAASGMSLDGLTALLVEHKKNQSDFENILIIPGVGCSGCISQAEYFFHDNMHDDNHLFIFTGIEDIKMFKFQIADSLWDNENVIVDKNNKIMDSGYDSVYPCYLKVGERNVVLLKPF